MKTKYTHLLKLTLVTTAIALTIPASAGILKSGHLMCTSKNGLESGIQLMIEGKTNMLRSVGCYLSEDGLNGTVINRGVTTSKVMLQFPNGESAIVWVSTEALSRK